LRRQPASLQPLLRLRQWHPRRMCCGLPPQASLIRFTTAASVIVTVVGVIGTATVATATIAMVDRASTWALEAGVDIGVAVTGTTITSC
jgi:hypothetical protein